MKYQIFLGVLATMLLFTLNSCEFAAGVTDVEMSNEINDVGLDVSEFDAEIRSLASNGCDLTGYKRCEARTLFAGQSHNVGFLAIYVNEAGNYKAVYQSYNDCKFTEVHLFVGSEEDIPKNRAGCPKVGHFPYKAEGLYDTQVCIDLGELDPAEVIVAGHAVVSCSGTPFDGEETAWSFGKRFPECRSWAMCWDFTPCT